MRDRTLDFHNFAQSQSNAKGIPHKSPYRPPPTPFATQSIQIGKNLAELARMVQRFQECESIDRFRFIFEVVEKNSLFDDHSEDINQLTTFLKRSIDSSKKEIEALEHSRQTERFRNSNVQAHAEAIIYALNVRLADSTKGFGEALQKRTQSTRAQQKRVDDLTGTPTVLRQRKKVGGDDSKESTIFIPMPGTQVQENIFAHTRSTGAVEKIESTLHELQKIFGQLAGLVQEQGEMLERVDGELFATSHNISEGQRWLLTYQKAISSNRGLIIKAFIFLIVFSALLIFLYK